MLRRFVAPFFGLFILVLLQFIGITASLSDNALDLLFRLRGPVTPGPAIVLIGVDEPSLQQLGPWPFPRDLHAKLLARLTQARAIGFDILFTESAPGDAAFSKAMHTSPPIVLALAHERNGKLLPSAQGLEGYAGTGHIETILSQDGIIRRVDLTPNGGIPPFSLALLQVAGIPPSPAPNGRQPAIINCYGPEESFLYLSYSDVLNGLYRPEFFKDKVVLVGARAVGIGDVHVTPFTMEHSTPGVEIQATIISNLLAHTFIYEIPWLTWLVLGAVAILAFFSWPITSERFTLLTVVCLSLSTFLAAILLFRLCLFLDFPQILLFLLSSYVAHLLIQLYTLTHTLFVQAKRLDHELQSGLQLITGLLPKTLLAPPDPQIPFSRIQGHLDRLQSLTKALSLQHHFLKQLLREELPPLILWDQDTGQVLFANDAFTSFWQGRQESSTPLPDRGTFANLITLHSARLPEESCTNGDGFTLESKYGKVSHFHQGILHPLVIPETDFYGLLAVLQDITELKELERIKDEVITVVSHELKLPLTTILGYGEMLNDSLTDTNQLYAREICGQANRLNQLIEDFLDIARLERGRHPLRQHPFPPNRLLADAISIVEAKARAKNIRLELRHPNRTSPLIGDEALLLQALINLLDNAIKFSPQKSALRLVLEEHLAYFQIDVLDQGPGIPPEEQTHIFDKFYRIPGQSKIKGFGLGLHLVKQIIDLHQGSINIIERSKGSVFRVTLPKNTFQSASEQNL